MLRRREAADKLRLFFATDIHGSERCFRKWLNAAAAYRVDILILGGDITGKMLVPLVASNGGWRGEFLGNPVSASEGEELQALQTRIRATGRYDLLLTEEEKERLDSDPAQLDERFRRTIAEGVERWVKLADERLAGEAVACFVMLGNDDFPELADILRSSKVLTYAEDDVFRLPGGYELVSLGYSTPTPWHTPRELSEGELAARIERLVAKLEAPPSAIFNLHCPPKGTHLDQAPALDEKLRPRVGVTGLELASAGSEAVRTAIEKYRPLLGLHGHVHESAAAERLYGTLCINPGSHYGEGVLRGAIVELVQREPVRRWQLTEG
jgi:Icc-related predicted phosphoesterase